MIYPRIRELRENKGLTQQQAAALINVPFSTYRSYETGAREPNIEILVRLSELYDVSIDYVLSHIVKPLINPEEIKQIQKYRSLDNYGKEVVSSVLDIEYKRCSSNTANESPPGKQKPLKDVPRADISNL